MLKAIASCNEVVGIEIDGKKKLLDQVLFTIDELNNEEEFFMLQALAKYEDQPKYFGTFQMITSYAFVGYF